MEVVGGSPTSCLALNSCSRPSHGVTTQVASFVTDKVMLRLPVVGTKIEEGRADARTQQIEVARTTPPSPVERIEARQLELTEAVSFISESLEALATAVQRLDHPLGTVSKQQQLAIPEGAFSRETCGTHAARDQLAAIAALLKEAGKPHASHPSPLSSCPLKCALHLAYAPPDSCPPFASSHL